MHPLTLTLAGSATLGVAFAFTQSLVAPRAPLSVAAAELTPLTLDASSRALLEGLAERVGELERRGPVPGSARAAEDLEGRVEALVAAALARAGHAAGSLSQQSTGPAAAAPAKTAQALALELADLDAVGQAALWKQLAAEGRADEVLAAVRARAEAAPHDPELQVELGQAYIARISEVGNSPLAGVLATQADQAFDRALAIDPGHYSARFNKAISLSFWPPALGKQPAAIAEFERLVAQQAQMTQEPRFAETHLLLGNLYQQTGKPEQALAAWQLGATLFPQHEGLAAQLALVGGAR